MGFPENLKRLRIKMGMTQVELAKAVGVNDRTIQKYEAGNVMPKTEIAKKLASELNVDFDELLGYKNEVSPVVEKDNMIKGLKALFMGGDFNADEKEKIINQINEAYYDAKRILAQREAKNSKLEK